MIDLTDDKFWNKAWSLKKGSQSNPFILSSVESRKTIAGILSTLPLNGKVIELGCAPGSYLELYHSLRGDLHYGGVDIAEDGVKITKELMEKKHIKGSVFTADLRRPVPDLENNYDLVCSHGLIEHFEDFGAIMKEHYKFSRPGGTIFITIPNYAHPFIKLLLTLFSKKTVETHNFKCMSLAALEKASLDSSVTLVESGSYGGPLIPHSNINPGPAGKFYRLYCRIWNVTMTLFSYLGLRRPMKRMWDINLYVLLKKNP